MAIINSAVFDKVYSYHVNVGHGNTSFVVMQQAEQTMIIAVDASECENGYKRFTSYLSNIDECITHIQNEFELDRFEIDIFLLTHPHWDHYSGIMHLITNQYITKNTLVWLNKIYKTPSGLYMSILVALTKLRCKFVDPIASMTQNCSFLKIWYPDTSPVNEKSKYYKRNKFKNNPIIAHPNNASVIAQILVANKQNGTESILFTGDIETEGWDKVKCPKYLGGVQYYCISHHGSANGHKRTVCHRRNIINAVTDCPNNISMAILMGRNGAHSGIYSQKVLKDFNNILKTEEDTAGRKGVKFLEVDILGHSHLHYF